MKVRDKPRFCSACGEPLIEVRRKQPGSFHVMTGERLPQHDRLTLECRPFHDRWEWVEGGPFRAGAWLWDG